MPKKSHLSSLPLQIVLYFSGWYLLLFYVAELALVIHKGERQHSFNHCLHVVAIVTVHYCSTFLTVGLVLPYPDRNLAAEIILLFFLAILDVFRIFLGE